jgi:RNA recognition motif-containing protein
MSESVSKVYVGNVSYSSSRESLENHFASAGEVVDVFVPMNDRGQPKGWALVEFASEDSASKAVDELNDVEFEGRKLFVKLDAGRPNGGAPRSPRGGRGGRGGRGRGGSRSPPPRRERNNDRDSSPRRERSDAPGFQVYVGNLPWKTTWFDLKDKFAEFGTVVRADVPRNEEGRSRGFGIVKFASEADMDSAISALDGSEFNGRTISVRRDKFQE